MQQPFFFIHLSSNAKKKRTHNLCLCWFPHCVFCNLFMQTIRSLFSMVKIKSRNCGIIFYFFCLSFLFAFFHINKVPFHSWVVGYFCLVSFCLSFNSSHQIEGLFKPKREDHCPRVHFGWPDVGLFCFLFSGLLKLHFMSASWPIKQGFYSMNARFKYLVKFVTCCVVFASVNVISVESIARVSLQREPPDFSL